MKVRVPYCKGVTLQDRRWMRAEAAWRIQAARGKMAIAWSVEADVDIDPVAIARNTFTLEWPPQSGQMKDFPEVIAPLVQSGKSQQNEDHPPQLDSAKHHCRDARDLLPF